MAPRGEQCPALWRAGGLRALSLLQSQWTYTGYDASAHVAEETVFARRASAWGVFLSVAVSAVVGYIVLVALTLKMTSPDGRPGQQRRRTVSPYILGQTSGRRLSSLGGLLAAGVAFAMTFCGFSSIASAGRMLFAFSRDDGVPGQRAGSREVHHRWRTPANSIIAISVFSWLLIAAGLRPLQGAGRRSDLPDRRHHHREHRAPVLGVWPGHRARPVGRPVLAPEADMEPGRAGASRWPGSRSSGSWS